MKKIDNIVKINSYANESLLNQYVYMKRSDKEYDRYYIYLINQIILNVTPKYLLSKCYILHVPKNDNTKCFTHDSLTEITVNYNDELFILDIDEFIDTFRVFVNSEGLFRKDLPIKIIQDKEIS